MILRKVGNFFYKIPLFLAIFFGKINRTLFNQKNHNKKQQITRKIRKIKILSKVSNFKKKFYRKITTTFLKNKLMIGLKILTKKMIFTTTINALKIVKNKILFQKMIFRFNNFIKNNKIIKISKKLLAVFHNFNPIIILRMLLLIIRFGFQHNKPLFHRSNRSMTLKKELKEIYFHKICCILNKIIIIIKPYKKISKANYIPLLKLKVSKN
jgi:hypothetical protein